MNHDFVLSFSSGSWQYQSGCMGLFFPQLSAKVRERGEELNLKKREEQKSNFVLIPLLYFSLLSFLIPPLSLPPLPSPPLPSPPPLFLLPPPLSSSSLLPYPASYHSSLFATCSPMVEGEGVEGYRVSQVVTILQNLSFEENSQQFLAQHTGVRR